MAKKTALKEWKKLKHARGSATATGDDVEMLRSDVEDEQNAAMARLESTLCQQAKFYTAAAQALPLLLELAQDEEVADRQRILALATNILTARHHGPLTTGLDQRDPDIKKRYARGASRSIYKAAHTGRSLVVELLESSDARVRAAAAFFLAFLYEDAEVLIPALQGRLEVEKDSAALASAAIGLGMLSGYGDDPDDTALSALTSNDDPLVAGAAEAARLYYRDRLEATGRKRLLGLILLGELDKDVMPWAYGRVEAIATRQLIDHLDDGRQIRVELLLEAVAETGASPAATRWGVGVIEVTFEKQFEPMLTTELSAEQREIVTHLAKHGVGGSISHGLLAQGSALRRWLGIDPPGPLDVMLVLEDEERPLWQHLRLLLKAREPAAAVYERLAALMEEESLLAVYGEWHVQNYGINGPPFKSAPLVEELIGKVSEAAAIAWGEKMAEVMLEKRTAGGPAELPLGKLPLGKGSIFQNNVFRALARAGAAPDARYDWLVYPLRSALELLPPERRTAVLLAHLRSCTKPSELATASLDLCTTPAVVAEMIRLLKTNRSMTVRGKKGRGRRSGSHRDSSRSG